MMNKDGLSKANLYKSLHEKVKAQIEKKVEKYARYSNKGRKKWFSNRVIGFGFT